MLNDIDLQEFGGTDSNLKKALKEYSVDYDEDEDSNYED
jgi:hypothetical protein